ncbi:unnamed protein product [Closterium sp. Yama58-4]|nr:unnamed protein product [Closterium sp. Yama58-4]
MRVLGSFGPRSSSNLSYWGLAGCVNNVTLLEYTWWADSIANYSSGTVMMVLQDKDSSSSSSSSSNLSYWGLAGCVNNVTLLEYTRWADSIANYSSGTVAMILHDQDSKRVPLLAPAYSSHPYPSVPPPAPPLPLTAFPCPSPTPSCFSPLPAPPLPLPASPYPSLPLPTPPCLSLPLPASPYPSLPPAVFVIPILRHPMPANASAQEIRESISTAWAASVQLEWRARNILDMLQDGDATPTYSFGLYDSTQPGGLVQIYGPDEPRTERGAVFPFVLPAPVVPRSDHVEMFPEGLFGRTYEAHCRRTAGEWVLGATGIRRFSLCSTAFHRNAPGLIVSRIAETMWSPSLRLFLPLESTRKPFSLPLLMCALSFEGGSIGSIPQFRGSVPQRGHMAEGVREMELCTAALEKAESSKSETVANLSHELRTPIIGMIGMIEMLLESPLEEWQAAGLRDAGECARETVGLINRVLDLAKLQAGRLQLETLPLCLGGVAQHAVALAAEDACARGLQAWQQLAARVRRFPPDTRLVCTPPHLTSPLDSRSAKPESQGGRLLAGLGGLGGLGGMGGLYLAGGWGWGRGARARCVDEQQKAGVESGGDGCAESGKGGRLEREVAAWVEGACRARGEGEWMVVMACEDTGGGIPPEEMRWVLDPYGGDPHHSSCSSAADDDDGGANVGGRGDIKKQRRVAETRRGSRATPLTHDERAAARPAWTPYPVRFLLSTSLVSAAILNCIVAFESHGIQIERCWSRVDDMSLSTECALHYHRARNQPALKMRRLSRRLKMRRLSRRLKMRRLSRRLNMRRLSRRLKTRRLSRRLKTRRLSRRLKTRRLSRRLKTGRVSRRLKRHVVEHRVAEMRGSMAVLSDSATGTTILLALPLSAPPLPTEPGSSSRRGEGREGQSRGLQHWMGVPRGLTRSSSAHSLALSPIAPLSPINPLSPAGRQLQTMPQLTLPSARGSIGSIGSSLGGSGRASVVGILGAGAGDAEAAVRVAVARRRVAVVDDNAVNRMVARRTLQSYGADVLLLASGEDALQAVSSPTSAASSIQLLLLDLHMPPGIDGFETARRIRRMESELLAAAERQLPSVAEATAADEADTTAADEAANEFTVHTPQESTPADGSDSEISFKAPQESTAANKAEEEEESMSPRRPSPQRLCIVALTADLDAGVKRACFEAGMDGAVRKPIVAHELLAALVDAGFFAASEMTDALVL